MKLKLHTLDDEIREVETRIARERVALDDAISGCTDTLRNAVTSPTALITLAGVGFVMGKLMFGRKDAALAGGPGKTSALGLLTGVAGTAMSLMRPGSGLVTLARWVAEKALAKRRSAQARAARASAAQGGSA